MLDTMTIIALGNFLTNGLNALKRKDPESGNKLTDIKFEDVAKKYCEHLENRYGKIKILNMEKPIELGKHYTRVNLLHKITARTKNKIELLEEQLRNQGHFGYVKDTKPAIEVITETNSKTHTYNNILLLGKPGAGKTTFLRYIALQALRGKEGQIKREVLPIMVELRYLSQSNKSLIELIEDEFCICGVPNAKPLIESFLEEGKCLVLLDGLDEVSKGKVNDVVNGVRNLVDKYNKNQFILSCRIAAYNHVFEQFHDVEVADFNDGQIKDFVLAWFGSDEIKSKTFLEELKKSKSIRELASTPILVALMCIDYDERMNFPTSRAELYKQCIDTLLEKWDAARSIQRDEIYKNLSKSKKKLMLARVAEEMFQKEKNFLPQNVLSQWIGNFIKNIPGIKPEEIDLDSEQVIKSIEAQHGIFVERAEGIYSFSHLTFQEYFTAKYIVDKNSYKQIVEKYLLSPGWKEVILLASGLVGEADDLLLAIKIKVDSLVDNELGYLLKQIFESSKLLEIVVEPDKVRNIEQAFPLEVRSIRVLLFCDFALARARALARALDRALDLARDRALDLALDLDLARDLARDRDRALDLALALALDLARDLKISWFREIVEISEKLRNQTVTKSDTDRFRKTVDEAIPQINKFSDYLYATNLLLECLRSDCYISKETREKIMNGLLTVPV